MHNRLAIAAQIAEFDLESIDMPLLIGTLVALKRWAESEPHLLALGKKSSCTTMRDAGEKLLKAQQAISALELDLNSPL